jgi:ubiquinone/menaquinone biosynthesis C-methylase UbiE
MYPQVSATGVDLSDRLIERAKMRAARRSLENCRFCRGDAQALPELPFPVDAVILSRLFLIVPDKQAVLSEVFRILRPGGRCFIAEPTSELRTRVPLSCLWLLAKMRDGLRGGVSSRFREPRQAEVMSRAEFAALVHGQPWTSVELVHDGWYQYAVCAKAQDEATTFADPASGASGASGD